MADESPVPAVHASPRYRFDADYEEAVTLKDGSTAWLRLVRPDDKQLLVSAFAHLSPQSRYRRFLAERTSLTPRELSYLTEVDGVRHFAIGALRRRDGHPDEGLGIARFIRLADRPEVAEAAVAVIDDMQRKGLGRILLRRLAVAARERGVERFYCEVLENNLPVQGILSELSLEPTRRAEDGVLSVEIDLSDLPDSLVAPESEAANPSWLPALPTLPAIVERLLALVAAGVVVVRRAVLLVSPTADETQAPAQPGESSPEDSPGNSPKDREVPHS